MMTQPRPQRDPERIPEVLDALSRYWTAHPDMRLGQILGTYNIDYNAEDRVLLEALRGGPELTEGTTVNIQYKGTELCIDVYCKCGVEGHFDGFFANNIRCPACGDVFGLPFHPAPLPPHNGLSTVTFDADDTEDN